MTSFIVMDGGQAIMIEMKSPAKPALSEPQAPPTGDRLQKILPQDGSAAPKVIRSDAHME
jgi:hypothetical protein